MKRKSPDQVCASFAHLAGPLEIRLSGRSTVVIEGDQESLRFLGELLVAQSGFKSDCGFQIGPRGPGSAFFAKRSGPGLYIHRIPCGHVGVVERRLPNRHLQPAEAGNNRSAPRLKRGR